MNREKMETYANTSIRNLAIIAHVDHGKTTLVDALLKQGQVFRANQDVGVLIMDTNPLERERGITILAKNTAVAYKGVKINIIDTPGHADFSGEVERIMNMADGCLLLVDAVDGPMPQTRFVLQQALRQNVTPMVVINKIDRPEARAFEVVEMVQDLFLELATKSEHLDFPILYASARNGYAQKDLDSPSEDMKPLFDAILDVIPPPSGDPEGPSIREEIPQASPRGCRTSSVRKPHQRFSLLSLVCHRSIASADQLRPSLSTTSSAIRTASLQAPARGNFAGALGGLARQKLSNRKKILPWGAP